MRKTMAQLETRFTEVVASYVARGLRLDTNAMSGSQGEIGKVALTDGKMTYMIYLNRDYVTIDGEDDSLWNRADAVKLIVEMGNRKAGCLATFWLGDKEHTVVQQEVWYIIGHHNNYFTDDVEDYKAIRKIRTERHLARHTAEKVTVQLPVDKLVAIVKAKTGRKRVYAENIGKVERWHSTYTQGWKIITMFNGKEQVVTVIHEYDR